MSDYAYDLLTTDDGHDLPKETAMTTMIDTVHETRFGKFVPCDLWTYKKLKRINHLYTQFVRPENWRWNNSLQRLPKNRTFKRYVPGGKPERRPFVAEKSIFTPFFDLEPSFHTIRSVGRWDSSLRISPVTEEVREGQQSVGNKLLDDFLADFKSARYPVDSSEQVVPLKLSVAQIDKLLMDIEAWVVQPK